MLCHPLESLPLTGNDPDTGKDWRQEKKRTTEDVMASPTRWTWVWVNSRRWWWTGRPGVLWFMGSQRVRHDWATELNWAELWTWLDLCDYHKQWTSLQMISASHSHPQAWSLPSLNSRHHRTELMLPHWALSQFLIHRIHKQYKTIIF